ncbi:hypothetical protein [Streptomyces sp. NPDC048277]
MTGPAGVDAPGPAAGPPAHLRQRRPRPLGGLAAPLTVATVLLLHRRV